MTKDIFHKIAERERTAKTVLKKVIRYRIMKGSGGYANAKLYTKTQAERLIARAAKRGIDLYLADPMKITLASKV